MSTDVCAWSFRWEANELHEPQQTARAYGCLFVAEESHGLGVFNGLATCTVVGPSAATLVKFACDIGFFDGMHPDDIAAHIKNMKWAAI